MDDPGVNVLQDNSLYIGTPKGVFFGLVKFTNCILCEENCNKARFQSETGKKNRKNCRLFGEQ